MTSRDLPVVAGLGVFALIAVACALYAAVAGPGASYAIPGAILVLSAGMLAAVVVSVSRAAQLEEQLAGDAGEIRVLAGSLDAINERLDAMQHQIDNPPRSPVEDIAAEVRALRDGVARLAARPVPEAASSPPAAAPKAAEHEPVRAPDRLDLLLEPVIELATGATAHYRAQLHLVNDQGGNVGHDELMAKADQGGMREQLDNHILRSAAPILRKLRNRNPGLRLFVPLGATTLSSPVGIARIQGLLQQESDVASGIVFEVAQQTLASLDAAGIAHLAGLARQGVTLALVNVHVSGLDLSSLRQLGVKYLAIDAASFDAGFGTSSAWRQFSQYARAMQFQLIAARVMTAPQGTASAQLARYGHGPFFAPPRKVKADAGIGQPGARAAAA